MEAGDRIGKKPCYGRNPVNGLIQFLLTQEINGLSSLKEGPKSNPCVNQNKTRMSNYGLKALYSVSHFLDPLCSHTFKFNS